jgi:hypothetical protein
MSGRKAEQLLHSWETIRYELLNTNICDLHLTIANSPLQKPVRRLLTELTRKHFRFRPKFYLTDSWGCPNEVPLIGIPFYLADERLRLIEREQTGEIENESDIMSLLRHEAGHAVNYAYRLWERPDWTEVFGSFRQRYEAHFHPLPNSKNFVRHLKAPPYGRTYAQKHPDEDFAETFAVWLTPSSRWRQRYAGWPAMSKLQFVNDLARAIADVPPLVSDGERLMPISEMNILLIDHYGQRADRYSQVAQGYVDDLLRKAFPSKFSGERMAVSRLIRNHRKELVRMVSQWTDLDSSEVEVILEKLEVRSRERSLKIPAKDANEKLLEIAVMLTGMAANFYHTGRLST